MTTSLLHPTDLEPALLRRRTYASRRRATRVDSAALLSIMIFLLFALPARLIIPNLTYAGRPALLVAAGLWCWWLVARLNPRLVMVGPQPMRWVAGAFLLATLLSYIAGTMRGLPTIEANALNFTTLVVLEFLGVILVAADGIPNWSRLHGVLRVFVWSSGIMAAIGLIQSMAKFDLTPYLVFPPFQLKGDIVNFQKRGDGGLFRVAGTATHYIEFSAVMAMAVPYALHYARFAPERRHRLMFALITVLTAAAVPIALSRTGVVALAIAILVMFPAWNWRLRYNVLFASVGLLAAFVVLRPGLLGTLRSMFEVGQQDPSITGRTDDYAAVSAWFGERPWLGRGPGTLIPDLYRILDNQWLLTLVQGGIVGVIALAALHITCVTLLFLARRRVITDEDRHLCHALLSTQFVCIVVMATFDSFSFTTFTFVIALMSGIAGTMWRFTHPTRIVRTSAVLGGG